MKYPPCLYWVTVLGLLVAAAAFGHDPGPSPLGWRELPWHASKDVRVFAQTGDSVVQGGARVRVQDAHVMQHVGRKCVAGPMLHFDFTAPALYDIDETVELDLTLPVSLAETKIQLWYDRAEGPPIRQSLPAAVVKDGEWVTRRVHLERARLANRLEGHADIAIVTEVPADTSTTSPSSIVVCDIGIKRIAPAARPRSLARLLLRITDEEGRATPARVGVYDATGWSPLPGPAAIAIPRFTDQKAREIVVSGFGSAGARYVFYVAGEYQAEVPPGNYRLIVEKGPEYRRAERELRLDASQPTRIDIALERYANLARERWISGDTHVHVSRKRPEGRTLLTIFAAEDLGITSLLQMSSANHEFFQQYAIGPSGRQQQGAHAIVPGQESPRSAELAHWLALNPHAYYRPSPYFVPFDMGNAVRSGGGHFGLAHVLFPGIYNVDAALALAAPSGLVDFVEVLQFGRLGVDLWYDFLNLGFRLAPSAGSDYPWGSVPGRERVYVHTPEQMDIDAWFAGLAAGRSFVTNGPLLRFEIDGAGPGSTLQPARGAALRVHAAARLNPDLGRLDRIELVRNGVVVTSSSKSTKSEDSLEVVARHAAEVGEWWAARAYGTSGLAAHSAPIYVLPVGTSSFADCGRVPVLAQRALEQLDRLANTRPDWRDAPQNSNVSPSELESSWAATQPQLRQRIEQARAYYRALLDAGPRCQSSQ